MILILFFTLNFSFAKAEIFIDNKNEFFSVIEIDNTKDEKENSENKKNIEIVKENRKKFIYHNENKNEKKSSILLQYEIKQKSFEENSKKEIVKNLVDFKKPIIKKDSSTEKITIKTISSIENTEKEKKEIIVNNSEQINKEKIKQKPKNSYVDFTKVASKVKLKPQEADFSEYGVNKDEMANLMNVEEYQKKHGEELKKVIEERKQRYEEEDIIKQKIDEFFN